MSNSDVFISYSRQNGPFARRLIDRLYKAGKDAWVDWEGIPLTAPNWWAEIKAGIEGADSFIFILSPDSMASIVCNLELDYALELKKRIIPVVYREVVNRDASASITDYQPDAAMEDRLAGANPVQIARNNWHRLSHINWVFLRESDEFEAGFATLVRTVETDLAYVKAHTRYLMRALDWQRSAHPGDLLLFGSEIETAGAWLAKAEHIAQSTAGDKPEVVNPLPQAVQRDYIAASRRAQRRRRFVGASGVLVAGLAFAFAVAAALVGGSAARDAALARDEQATATRAVATAFVARAAAEAAIATATQQLAEAQATATTIPPTLTQAAVVQDIAIEFANIMLQQNDSVRAETAAINALVARYPDQARAYLARGLLYDERGEQARAIEDYDQSIRLDPNNAGAYNNRGTAHFALGSLQDALADYDQALRLDPNFAIAYTNRGNVRSELGDAEGAIADYDQAIRLDADDASAYNSRGLARYSLGDVEGALADYDQAIRLDPEYASVYNNRGMVRYDLGNLQDALEDFDLAIRLDPETALVFYNRANVRYELGDAEGAIEDYDQAIRLDANDASAYNNRGLVRYSLGDVEGAIADYDQAIRLDPEYASAYDNRGLARYSLDDVEGAIADYDQAIRLDPDFASPYENRGLARYRLDDLKGAIEDYSQAIRIDPEFASAYLNRGIVYYVLVLTETSSDRRANLGRVLADWRMAESLGYELPQVVREAIAELETELRMTPTPSA